MKIRLDLSKSFSGSCSPLPWFDQIITCSSFAGAAVDSQITTHQVLVEHQSPSDGRGEGGGGIEGELTQACTLSHLLPASHWVW